TARHGGVFLLQSPRRGLAGGAAARGQFLRGGGAPARPSTARGLAPPSPRARGGPRGVGPRRRPAGGGGRAARGHGGRRELGWDAFLRSELSVAGVRYRHDTPSDEFVRLRQGFDLTRGVGWRIKGHEVELGLYAIYDLVVDPPTAPVANGKQVPIQAEFGFTV